MKDQWEGGGVTENNQLEDGSDEAGSDGGEG